MATMTRTNRPRKGNPKGERRYPKGAFPTYDQLYELKLKKSPILNDDIRRNDIRNSQALHDLVGCKQTLIELVGNPQKDYHYLQNDTWKLALIPGAESNLLKIRTRFNQWAERQVKDGHALTKPNEWPKDLLEKRLKAEAILDIYRREKAVVEKAIEAHKELAQKEREEIILEYGPKGHGIEPPPEGSRREWAVDGQRVSRNSEGIPYINEPASPYHEMPLVHYRQMANQWKADYRKEVEESWEEVEGGMRHKKTGKVITELAYARLYRGRQTRVTKKELPAWPKNAKKITELEE